MSTITFGPQTFAILANHPASLANAVGDQGATHWVKCYDSSRDFSGDAALVADENGRTDNGHTVWGLLYQIDRAASDDTTARGYEVNMTDGVTRTFLSDFEHAVWEEAEFLPLYLLGAALPADIVPLMPAEAETTLTMAEAASRAGVGGVIARPAPHADDRTDEWRIVAAANEYGELRATVASYDDDDSAISVDPGSTYGAAQVWRVVSVGDTTPTPVPTHTGNLPRSAAEAINIARAMQDLARWLPGGELESTGHEHAENASLCGVYESTVCPTFGWTPRRGEHNSSMRLTTTFFAEMDAFERDNADKPLAERLALWLARYDAGGPANMAVVDAVENHLEEYKVHGVNTLLEDVLGWEPADVEQEYEIEVRVRRTIQVDVEQTVTITRTARDGDSAADMIDSYDLADYVDAYNWEDENGSTHYASTRGADIDDYDVVDVQQA